MIRCCYNCQNHFAAEKMETYNGLYYCQDCYDYMLMERGAK